MARTSNAEANIQKQDIAEAKHNQKQRYGCKAPSAEDGNMNIERAGRDTSHIQKAPWKKNPEPVAIS
jgi:hypothetical protein